MAKSRYHYNIMLRPEPEGGYTALVPALPGCVTYGRTVDEAREMAKDAISGYIASLRKHKDLIPTDDNTLVASLDLEYAEVTRRYSPVRSAGFWSRTASFWITPRAATSLVLKSGLPPARRGTFSHSRHAEGNSGVVAARGGIHAGRVDRLSGRKVTKSHVGTATG